MEPKINEILSARQIFGFLIPGFLLFIELLCLLIPLLHWQGVSFLPLLTIFERYKELTLLWGTVIIIFTSYLLGIINVYLLSPTFYSKFPKSWVKQQSDNIIGDEDFYRYKYYVIDNSEKLGKKLYEIESEINLYYGLLCPLSFILCFVIVCLFASIINLIFHFVSDGIMIVYINNLLLFVTPIAIEMLAFYLLFILLIICRSNIDNSLQNERESAKRFYDIIVSYTKS